MTRVRVPAAVLAIFTVFATACSSNDTAVEPDRAFGSADVRLSLAAGDEVTSSGRADFTAGKQDSYRGPLPFYVRLRIEEDEPSKVEIVNFLGAPGVTYPTSRVYEFVPPGSAADDAVLETHLSGSWNGHYARYTVLDGHLEVRGSSESHVDGEFTLIAGLSSVQEFGEPEISMDPNDPAHQVRLTGTFHAIPNDEPVSQLPLPVE